MARRKVRGKGRKREEGGGGGGGGQTDKQTQFSTIKTDTKKEREGKKE